jgi:hypothetical protein
MVQSETTVIRLDVAITCIASRRVVRLSDGQWCKLRGNVQSKVTRKWLQIIMFACGAKCASHWVSPNDVLSPRRVDQTARMLDLACLSAVQCVATQWRA